MKKKILKVLLFFLGAIIILVVMVILAFSISPKPGTLIIRHMFDSEVKITDQKSFEKAEENIITLHDKKYTSRFKKNTFDLYYPQTKNKKLPLLVWVHGGGFVGGDKEGTKEFATRLAADAHIAVLSMNYEPAPESAYPNQLTQVSELIAHLKKHKPLDLDLSKVMFGGDSAGSQIALQYVTTQTNPEYGKSIGIPQALNKNDIKAAISYCGPVNLKQMTNLHSNNLFMKFFVNTVAWAEIGTRAWKESPKLSEVSLVDHLNKSFPATYITDGNSFSFQDQGIALEKRLKELQVPVQGLFYKSSKKEITHEYQFDYSLKESKNCYRQTVNFVKKYSSAT